MPKLYRKLSRNFSLLLSHRELLYNLVRREITQRYKQSILGYFWIILNPLFQMLVMNFVFSLVLKVESLGIPFIVFLSAALLPWNFFAHSLVGATNSLVQNSNLITKIYFPREILVLASIISKLVDFIFSLLILVVFLVIFKIPITIFALWFFPILIIQILLTLGISLIISALNLFYRDIQYLLSMIITLWMYLTPIMYPVEMIPDKFRFVFKLNPMAVIVNAYRQVILGGSGPNLSSLSIAFFASLFTFILGFLIFKKMEGKFADYV